jgi:hypothetical protein
MTRSASSFLPVSMMIGIIDCSRSLRASCMPSSLANRKSSTTASIAFS